MSNQSPERRPSVSVWKRFRDRVAEMTLLEQVLWAVVGVLAIVFVVAYSSPTLPTSTPIAAAVPSATRAPQNVSSLRSPIPTRSPG